MSRKLNLGTVLFLGLSVSMLLAATYQSLMISGSGVCSQFVNLNAGAQLYGVNIATESYVQEHSGMWELIERWEPAEATSSHTFSSLNGNTDRRYLVRAIIVSNSVYGAAYIYPNSNSDDTYYRQDFNTYGTTFGASRDSYTGGFFIGNIDDSSTTMSVGEAIIEAKSGRMRVSRMTWSTYHTSGDAARASGFASNNWPNTADNITSLTVAFGTNGFGVGSCVELWKLAQ